ncbi:hypothetical protein ACQY0O_005249 [Thecaphora frezii]
MSGQGTTKGVLRSLKHLNPPKPGSKFAIKAPSHAAHRPKFVHVKDRIPFWNIVPGDHVRLRAGCVGQKEGLDDESGAKVRGEGIVESIDREKNWVWLRDVDENNRLAPKAIRHIVPRYIDPTDPSKGFGPNVTEVPRPVHYSNLMLKVPGSDQYAVRLTRSSPIYDRRRGMYTWKRYATIKLSEKQQKETGQTFEKVEVPWPKLPGKRRQRGELHSDKLAVETETWAPWRPEDPVCLPLPKQTTSVQSRIRALLQQAERARLDAHKASTSVTSAPADALGTYAGFKADRAKPAPIAQPPTPAETVRAQRDELVTWATATEIVEHQQEGGLAFTAADYLDIAPRSGPATGGDWSELPHAVEEGGLDGPRDAETGRLKNGVGRNDLDRMPIELLMQKDLTNPSGLKWRMRRWKEKQQVKQLVERKEEGKRKALLKELEVLKL